MFFKKVWVKSHLIEEGAYNENYCPEPTVFWKRSKLDRHLIKPFSFQIKSKEDKNNQQSHIPSLFPERKIKQEIICFFLPYCNYFNGLFF